MRVRRFSWVCLILVFVLAPVLSACDVFGGDDGDDDTDETEAPTEDVAATPEATEEADETAPDEDATRDGEEPAPTGDGAPEDRGAAIFNTTCAACHQPEGEGIEGIYPALAESPFVAADDPGAVIDVVLTGRGGMPRFADAYTNEEVAAIVTYIRTNLGNDAGEVAPEDVEQARQALGPDEEESEETGGEQTGETGDEEETEGSPTPEDEN